MKCVTTYGKKGGCLMHDVRERKYTVDIVLKIDRKRICRLREI